MGSFIKFAEDEDVQEILLATGHLRLHSEQDKTNKMYVPPKGIRVNKVYKLIIVKEPDKCPCVRLFN